jgi:tRNA pseudouridine13 synthase
MPGLGGRLRDRPEDFLVEEQPLYEPSGEGEHLYLFLEKRNATTQRMVRDVAKAFGLKPRDVGFAGQKDRRAVTRQMISLPVPEGPKMDEGLARLRDQTPYGVLWVDRHTNKLKRGHLAGNRFVVYIRGVEPTCVLKLRSIVQALVARGVPNYFGDQRFGLRGNNHRVGAALLAADPKLALDRLLGEPAADQPEETTQAMAAYRQGDFEAAVRLWPDRLRSEGRALKALAQGKPPAEAVKRLDPAQQEMFAHAWQSAVFNAWLAHRLNTGRFDRLLPGDLAIKHDSGALFAVDRAVADQDNAEEGRVASLAVSPTGPLWGPKMRRAADEADRLELQALARWGLNPEHLAGFPRHTPGGRRAGRVPLGSPEFSAGMDDNGGYARLAFDLPAGAFATIVLREVMKVDSLDSASDNTGDEPKDNHLSPEPDRPIEPD